MERLPAEITTDRLEGLVRRHEVEQLLQDAAPNSEVPAQGEEQ